ncbi:hypothetical protein BB737_10160 [Mycobacterium avium subsp. hominissuis]|uniref:Uncharacterized protein n=3 Tax=Mycobacterium TaxID=1763 RepID=A0AA37V0S6_9MYCO|nr:MULTISPECIES: hypothetical protein [Mycobacterium]PBJ39089.1 hypothetical protein XV03_03690 [Mycobacterium avium subsp. hominissuis]PBJ65968.1 hypothetical protein BB737_10160 [Mycobacterium avium subsp. hominissuis]GLB86448.1 hypothetical protein SRL2020028_57040 [Mycobacterium kiyosense]
MTIWTLDITDDHNTRSIVGTAHNPHAARAAALRAIGTANAAAGFTHPHYTAKVDGNTIAIIGTGVDAAGLPDHRAVAELLTDIDAATNPAAPH